MKLSATNRAINKGIKELMVTSAKITSILKITPAIGELNIAEIAPAEPHPIQ